MTLAHVLPVNQKFFKKRCEMSYTNLAMKAGTCVLAFSLAACGTIGGRTNGRALQAIGDVPQMSQVAVVRDPCNSVGIEAIPETQLTRDDVAYNKANGYRRSSHNGFAVFSKEPLASKFGPLVGGLAGAIAGSAIGGGSVRLITGTVGLTAGALVGESFGKASRVEYLTDLAACRDYLNQVGPAPFRRFIGGGPADRPHGAPAKVFDQNGSYDVQIAPYSATSPGGSREVRPIRRPGFGD
jgi:hypothetical protein